MSRLKQKVVRFEARVNKGRDLHYYLNGLFYVLNLEESFNSLSYFNCLNIISKMQFFKTDSYFFHRQVGSYDTTTKKSVRPTGFLGAGHFAARSKKTRDTGAATPAPKNHFWERVTPSPAPENHFHVRVTL
jgi:hypothetical protein